MPLHGSKFDTWHLQTQNNTSAIISAQVKEVWVNCSMTTLTRNILLMPFVRVRQAQPFYVIARIMLRCLITNTHSTWPPKASSPILTDLPNETKPELNTITQIRCNINIIRIHRDCWTKHKGCGFQDFHVHFSNLHAPTVGPNQPWTRPTSWRTMVPSCHGSWMTYQRPKRCQAAWHS